MFKDWFSLFYWALIITLGGGGIHLAASKMRKMALERVSEPWPSLQMEYKHNTDSDPFVVVKKNGRTYILHRDRMKK